VRPEANTSFGEILSTVPLMVADRGSFQDICLVIFPRSVSPAFHHRLSSTHTILFLHLCSYVSVILLITGSYVFWSGTQFSNETCRRLSPLPTVFKCPQILPANPDLWLNYLSILGLQAMIVQVIMGWRYVGFRFREYWGNPDLDRFGQGIQYLTAE
jgi:hypothetical protein